MGGEEAARGGIHAREGGKVGENSAKCGASADGVWACWETKKWGGLGHVRARALVREGAWPCSFWGAATPPLGAANLAFIKIIIIGAHNGQCPQDVEGGE